MTDIRLFFSKKDIAKYISHLDLVRLFSRAVMRCELPIWFTEGFNPHPYMTFALPLSLGIESEREAIDIRLNEDLTLNNVVDSLNKVLPNGIKMLDGNIPKYKPKEIVSALYEITVSGNKIEQFNEFINQNQILVQKKSKKQLTEIDLKNEFEIKLLDQKQDLVINILLPTGLTKNINPNLFTNAFLSFSNEQSTQVNIVRKAIYCANGEIFS